MIEEIAQFFEAVGEAVGKFDAGYLCIFEEMWEPKFIASFLLILILAICVWYSGAASSPLAHILHIFVANLHALVVEAGGFGEASDDEVGFPFDALDVEVEPARYAVGVGLLLEVDLVCIMGCLSDTIDVAAFEIAPEGHIADFNDFTLMFLNLLCVFIGLSKIEFLDGLFFEDDQLQFRFFSGFVSFVFAMFVEGGTTDLFRENIGEDLVLGILELIVGLIFIWVGLHKFIIMGLDGFYWDGWGSEGKDRQFW